jgi:DNA-binding Lrp family transcriptional regulator
MVELNKKMKEILEVLRKEGRMGASQMVAEAGCNSAYVQYYLKKLYELKLVKRIEVMGRTKPRIYWEIDDDNQSPKNPKTN